MRNVALRMKNKEKASCVVVWKQSWRDDVAEQLAHARAERIMQRVAGRWRNQDVAAGFLSWHQKWRCDADEARALGMMRRVGARMRMREVVEAVSEWRAAAAAGVLQMVQPSMVLSAFLRNVLCLAVAAAAGAVRTQSQRA